MEHHWINYLILNYSIFYNTFVLKERDGQLGFNTMKPDKIREAYGLRGTIELDQLAFTKDIISAGPDPERTGEAVLEKLMLQISEMREYNLVKLTGDDIRITSIFTADGKRIHGRTDDIRQALGKGLDVIKRYVTNMLPPDQYPVILNIRENRSNEQQAKRQKLMQTNEYLY